MGLEMKVKRALLKELAKRYQRGSKREKSLILEKFVSLTGYNRCYASWLLRNCGRKIILSGKDGEQVVVIGEVRKIKSCSSGNPGGDKEGMVRVLLAKM